MSRFMIPKRYDSTIADEGVEFRMEDANGNYYGTFKCRLIDEYSQRGEMAYKRIRAKYAAQIKSKKLSDYDAIKVVFVEASLCGWSDIKLADGADVPFSVENAMEYFGEEDTKWILVELTRLASDITNFAVVAPSEEAEAVEGNS